MNVILFKQIIQDTFVGNISEEMILLPSQSRDGSYEC